MKTIKTIFLAAIFMVGFLFTSCNIDETEMEDNISTTEVSNIQFNYNENGTLKRDFAIALAKSMEKSVALREFLKVEALNQFDNDYDILYHLIKNKKLSDNTTLRQLLIENYEDENRLVEIENSSPLLTIFIPDLPMNSFSSNLWDIQNVVPKVAIKIDSSMDVPIFSSNGEEYIMEAGIIPGFPVVVIKENERVVLNSKNSEKRKDLKVNSKNKSDMEFLFLDNAFNREYTINTQNGSYQQRSFIEYVDQKLVDAYDIYSNVDGWQRDYVYYGLTPSNSKGPFSYDYQEHITSFQFEGNPNSAYSKISDQTGDPIVKSGPWYNPYASSWTDGFFEFKVTVLLNAKNGIGSEFTTYFHATPNDLFLLKYNTMTSGIYGPEYQGSIIRSKQMNLNLPLFNWDLNQYASTIKIEIEEVDLSETTTITDTRTVKFATNFAIDAKILKKIGLKFGASLETTQTHTIQKKFTQENDRLGSVIINFADDIILNHIKLRRSFGRRERIIWETRDYNSGWYRISVEPVKVQ